MSACKVCTRQYHAEHFRKNRERILAWFKAYKRPASTKERRRLWFKTNRDRVNAAHREMYHRNLEKYRGKSRVYWRAHAAEKLAHTRKRRALQYGSGGTHTKKQIAELFKKQRG